MNAEGWFVVAVLLLVGGVIGARFFRSVRIEPAGMVRGNDFSDEKLRRAAIQAVKSTSIMGQPRETAQKLIEEAVRHAVGKEYANIYKGVEIEVTETWPSAICIIPPGNTAVVEIWVGHTMDNEGIKPIMAEVNRAPAIKLDGKKPIAAALAEINEPPPKQAVNAKPSPAPAAKQGPTVGKAMPQRRK
jgi:hypothetical protein